MEFSALLPLSSDTFGIGRLLSSLRTKRFRRLFPPVRCLAARQFSRGQKANWRKKPTETLGTQANSSQEIFGGSGTNKSHAFASEKLVRVQRCIKSTHLVPLLSPSVPWEWGRSVRSRKTVRYGDKMVGITKQAKRKSLYLFNIHVGNLANLKID